jgi:hypothetical protein
LIIGELRRKVAGAKGKTMAWLVLFVVLAFVGVVGIVVNVNRLRFDRRVAAEMRTLVAVPPSCVPRPGFAELPPPVERYRQLAVGGRAPVRTLRMHHGGTFCTSPTAKAVTGSSTRWNPNGRPVAARSRR